MNYLYSCCCCYFIRIITSLYFYHSTTTNHLVFFELMDCMAYCDNSPIVLPLQIVPSNVSNYCYYQITLKLQRCGRNGSLVLLLLLLPCSKNIFTILTEESLCYFVEVFSKFLILLDYNMLVLNWLFLPSDIILLLLFNYCYYCCYDSFCFFTNLFDFKQCVIINSVLSLRE